MKKTIKTKKVSIELEIEYDERQYPDRDTLSNRDVRILLDSQFLVGSKQKAGFDFEYEIVDSTVTVEPIK
jgi:hypothetical protein